MGRPPVASGGRTDLADEVERGGERLVALLPLGRADLAGVLADVLGCLDPAEQLGGVATDTLRGDLDELDHPVGVDDEGAAVGQPFALAQDLEVARDHLGGVADHLEGDLGDGVGRLVPGLVGEVGVGGHAVDVDAERLELAVVVGEVAELGRADEGEVGRVEEHDGPAATQVGVGDRDELAVLVGGGGERLDLGVDQAHVHLLWRGCERSPV